MSTSHEAPNHRRQVANAAGAAGEPSTLELVRAFGKVGCLGFGGPAGQAALLQRVVVDERRWLDARGYADGLALCTVLPGPEAMQLATWTGWQVAGARGAAIAATLFVLPGAACVWLAAATWTLWSAGAVGTGAVQGLRCAVVCLLVAALFQLARGLQVRGRALALGCVSAVLASPPISAVPVALLVGAILGIVLLRGRVDDRGTEAGRGIASGASSSAAPSCSARATSRAEPVLVQGAVLPDSEPVASLRSAVAPSARTHARPQRLPTPASSARRPLLAGLLLLAAAWIAPLVALAAWQGGRVAEVIGLLSELALFGFGGAYTMVAWFGDSAVAQGWVAAPLVAESLGVAEATPGPLVLALQFMSHHALATAPGTASPLAAGTLGACVAVWSIFLPSALWVLAASRPYERVRHAPILAPMFAGVRAASLGVLLALSIQLAQATLLQGPFAASFVDGGSVATCVALGAWLACRRASAPLVLAAGIALRLALAYFAGV
jgi:chromate transporter